MIDFSIIDAKPFHVGNILRKMRRAHRDACTALGGDLHHELSDLYGQSSIRKAIIQNGNLVALFGMKSAFCETSGFVWLVLSDGLSPQSLTVIRQARKQLDILSVGKAELKTTVPAADRLAVRMASLLGFSPIPFQAKNGLLWMSRTSTPQNKPSPHDGPFVIFGLPRSRTKWLSSFLSHENHVCHHDLTAEVSSLSELRDKLSVPGNGTSETSLAHGWPMLLSWFPNMKIVVIRRDVNDVMTSLEKCGLKIPLEEIQYRNDRLDEISALPRVMTVDFNDIDKMSRKILFHCHGYHVDDLWVKSHDANIQIDIPERLRLLEDRHDTIAHIQDSILAKSCDVTMHVESFSEFYRDAKYLLGMHAKEAGPMDGMPFDPDIDMAMALYNSGSLMICTARCSGLIVGYIFFIISPSLESRGILLGVRNIWYVHPAWRGRLGLKLHDFASDRLRERGVSALTLRSGVRADGPRHFKYYERKGAKDMGRLYHLPL